ncbi:histidinol-phosphate aminotransferase [Methanocella paludicola SANAE]|uniref:Histidinol-phosphate aminotransferase n=1 Tax=Methanocella paludicola (strain DSM 17711 / JCM 13418 / NBRC 101707 / SANAE) TaxID=304371 RepID=D1YXA6_METPS|nr:histidinol-phosphate aminotransferase [Methanocella paludicola SANAE]
MSPVIRPKPSIERMKEYVAGRNIEEVARSYGIDERDVIKLASNENCLGPSPLAVSAIKKAASSIHLYPSVDGVELREALAAHYDVPVGNIVTGPGMDGVMETLLRVFLDKGDEIVIPLPTFSYYENVAGFSSAVPVFSTRRPDYGLDIEDILSKVSERTKFIFITSPNNPTGNVTPVEDIERIASAVDCLVFVDEAYIDFADRTALGLVRKYDNVIVGRTMSKAWGLAGLRIGFAFVPEWVLGQYMKAATPHSISRVSIAAAIGALGDKEYYEKSVETVRKGRKYLAGNIPFRTLPSEANFILMDVSPLKSKYVADECMKRGIILRDCTSFRGMGDTFVRVTVGTPAQNKRLVEALKDIRGGA